MMIYPFEDKMVILKAVVTLYPSMNEHEIKQVLVEVFQSKCALKGTTS